MLKGVMEVTGKSSVTVRMWLKGLSTPCLAEQKAISEYLGVPCEELFKS
nr:MAG TPA: SOS-response transcriptional repressor [Caudoviricetes sp.]